LWISSGIDGEPSVKNKRKILVYSQPVESMQIFFPVFSPMVGSIRMPKTNVFPNIHNPITETVFSSLLLT
jgi:hypothetical protein